GNGRSVEVSAKLYVVNLSYQATEEDLRELFQQAGTVESVRIITDQFTGRPRGFGFVEMSTKEEAERAIEQLNGRLFRDRNLVVNEARPQPSRSPGGGRGGGRREGGPGGGGGGGGGRRSRRDPDREPEFGAEVEPTSALCFSRGEALRRDRAGRLEMRQHFLGRVGHAEDGQLLGGDPPLGHDHLPQPVQQS